MERLWSRAVATGGTGGKCGNVETAQMPETVAVGCHQLPQKCHGKGHPLEAAMTVPHLLAAAPFAPVDQEYLFEARQMQALSFAVHIPIVCFGIAFPAFVLFMEALWLRTGNPVYRTVAKRWSKVMLALFAVGVVTGTILSFELGLLWPEFMATYGDVFGLAFALEGFSFFVEAIFIAIYVYGWDRLSRRAHFLTGIPIVNVNNNCATGSTALLLARDWVRAGLADCVLAVGFEKMDPGVLAPKGDGMPKVTTVDKHLEVLLATHLNGAPLPPPHGFPLRAVVPGWIGARSVKWLGRITLRNDPSPNYFQSQAYRVQREIDRANPRSVARGVALSELPVNSVILEPQEDQRIAAGQVRVRGWAMGTAARPVSRVELSTNDGADWVPARISRPESAWAWVFWEATLNLAPGEHRLVVRAADSSGASQPSRLAATWNVKGYSNNAWHRVTVRVERGD
jgi:hypothetical protein